MEFGGDGTTGTSEYLCSVRQGCPESSFLLNLFISDIFDGMEEVYVPSLGKSIPEILFADDSVVIANTPDPLQRSLNPVSRWVNP
ncbi:hypothetical protein AYI68_g3298 [Smittium mucronatum]|uniref:Reverse transcriptase domain-containing protein n=1 Tax=Smittium mucronatum TaxID=133383 RepID=A0A1R0H0C1_9FUNG|nr:hypothetical protein AYI68_g3298 [Smittium mucronatum]